MNSTRDGGSYDGEEPPQILATNKKRPGPLRVVGRPNSPPPELLKHKVRFLARTVNSTFVLRSGPKRPCTGSARPMVDCSVPKAVPQGVCRVSLCDVSGTSLFTCFIPSGISFIDICSQGQHTLGRSSTTASNKLPRFGVLACGSDGIRPVGCRLVGNPGFVSLSVVEQCLRGIEIFPPSG
jgi:hypothetical protein